VPETDALPAASSASTFPPQLASLLVGLTVGWGFNWPAMKIVLAEMAPLHFRTLCLAFGAVGLFSIAWMGGFRIRVPAGQWGRLAAIALFTMSGWNIFAIYGLTLLASGRAAILGYTMPAWSVLLSAWLLHEPLTRRRMLGVALGGGGMLLLLGSEIQSLGRSPAGGLLMIAAAFCWALGAVFMKRWPVALPATAFTAWQMLIGVIPILVIALLFERGSFNALTLSARPMLGVLYNILVAYNFCYWAWTKMVTLAPVGVASLAIMMVPVVGVFSGMLLLGEAPHWQDYAALVLVVASLATVLRPGRAPRASADR
jgi:drug/metabolite transporter (DMT)-like permease